MYVCEIKYTPFNNGTYNNFSIHHHIQLQPCTIVHAKKAALASFNVRAASFCYEFILLVYTISLYYMWI